MKSTIAPSGHACANCEFGSKPLIRVPKRIVGRAARWHDRRGLGQRCLLEPASLTAFVPYSTCRRALTPRAFPRALRYQRRVSL